MKLGHPKTGDPEWVQLKVEAGETRPGWERYSPTILINRIENVEALPTSLFEPKIEPLTPGVVVLRRFLSLREQLEMLQEARTIIHQAPFFTPEMADGTSFRQQLSNCGEYGWVAGQSQFHRSASYRYEKTHPTTGKTWPTMPASWQQLCDRALAEVNEPPTAMQSCLLNWYSYPHGRLGMHVDKSETDQVSPIVTVSLGHPCQFKIATYREGAGQSTKLRSGDITIMYGPSRLIWHGVLRLLDTDISLTDHPGRLSLTFRKVY